jgi:hypothetical protein
VKAVCRSKCKLLEDSLHILRCRNGSPDLNALGRSCLTWDGGASALIFSVQLIGTMRASDELKNNVEFFSFSRASDESDYIWLSMGILERVSS